MSEAKSAPADVETGLIIPVPEFEPFFREHRAHNAAVSPEGVPAHLTLLYPFLAPDRCDASCDEVASFFAGIEPFEFELSHVGWFDERVVFLAPADPAPFVELTERLIGHWSQCTPYGGRHEGKHVPHLTLGIEGTPEEMASLAAAAEKLLPIRCVASEAWLMVVASHTATWALERRFDLGAAPSSE